MRWVCLVAGLYQLLAIFACLRARSQKSGVRSQNKAQSVSVLKPVRGADEGLREALRSHSELEGEYELLCGVSDPNDPAVALIAEFPKATLVICPTTAPNAKAGVLMDLAKVAKHPLIVINDADVRVDRDYLWRITAPLADPRVGLVTCLFRPIGATFPGRIEGLSVSTDFAPGALIAPMFGVDEFAIGATMAVRRADLDRIGGFAAVADYVADDYQLGRQIHMLGLKCVLSNVVVGSGLGGGWRDVWTHQVRWARTIRVSKFGGYIGLPVTWATVWAGLAFAFGDWWMGAALLTLRMITAILCGYGVLGSRDALALWWAIPLRDLFGVAIWVMGVTGDTVVWRGRKLKLNREGRIQWVK